MTREEMLKKIENLKSEALKSNMEIKINENLLDPERLDVTWYGGIIGSIFFDKYIIEIAAYGDVRGYLTDSKKNEDIVFFKDKNNNGAFYNTMESYIKNDEELYKLMESTEGIQLIYDDNNWLEYNIINTLTNEYLDLPALENVLETNNVLEAFEDVSEYIDIIKYYELDYTQNEKEIFCEKCNEKTKHNIDNICSICGNNNTKVLRF